jgi:hypothetical protein
MISSARTVAHAAKEFLPMMKNVLPALLALVAACGGEAASPLTADLSSCGKLRDHVVELRLGEEPSDREQHRAALRDALGESFLDRCESMSRDQVECALASGTREALAGCAGNAGVP